MFQKAWTDQRQGRTAVSWIQELTDWKETPRSGWVWKKRHIKYRAWRDGDWTCISFPTSHILTIAATFSVVVAASLLPTGDADALLCPPSTTHSFCPSTPSHILLRSSATSKSSYCFKPCSLLTAGSLPCSKSIMLSENLPLSPPDSFLGLSPLPGPTLARTARRHQPQAGPSDW